MTWHWGSGRFCACFNSQSIRLVLVIEGLILDLVLQPLSWFLQVYLIVDFQPVIVQHEAQLGISNLIWCWASYLYAMEPTKAVLQLG
jgi:hypothetical protein